MPPTAPMTELVTLAQANAVMLALLVVAPLAGLGIGWSLKARRAGLAWGAAVGLTNYALWRVYNAVTDRLGLDTVKNLLVNVGLFLALGLLVGLVSGLTARRRAAR